MPSKNGAFIPRWSNMNYETGQMEFALEHEDFEKVRLGYGCSVCLADYHGVYLTQCNVCGAETLEVVPQWWTSRSVV